MEYIAKEDVGYLFWRISPLQDKWFCASFKELVDVYTRSLMTKANDDIVVISNKYYTGGK